MEQPGQGYFIPIACRFVPTDQWFNTHLHTSWKISDVKSWLLAKCLPELFTPIPPIPRPRYTHRRRRMSPITFATRDEISDEEQVQEGDAYDAYIDDVDPLTDPSDPLLSDNYKYIPRHPAASTPNKDIIPKANSASSSSDPAYYVLLVYSTGQILEDHYTLEWYPVHPHELFELHPYPFLVKLPRACVGDYVKPYFEVNAWVLRLLDDFGSSARIGDRLTKVPETVDQERDKLAKKRRLKIFTWQERWIVVREGRFHICKERQDFNPLESVPLSAMVSIRGADYIKDIRKHSHDAFTTSRPGISEKRIICVKFRYESRPTDTYGWFRRGSRDATAGEEPRKVMSTTTEDDDAAAEDGDTIVFVLAMRDEVAFDNILRVLHRDSHSAPSSFVPASAKDPSPRLSYSPISFASISPADSPASSPDVMSPARDSTLDLPKPSGVKYPEWRIQVVRKARRAGLGDVGRAMELAMFDSEIDDEDSSEEEDRQSRREQRRGRQPNDKWNSLLGSDSDQESAEDSGSEREWEGWRADITSSRRRRYNRPPESGVQWESGWQWGNNGSPKKTVELVPPTSIVLDDYEFPGSPAAATIGASVRANMVSLNVPPRTLSSYASADSLLKRSLQSNSLRRPRRPESPSSYLPRSRPRSPLAGELDDMDYYGLEPSFVVPSPPQLTPDVAYPTRTSHESTLRYSTGTGPGHPGQRVPMSMTMTTITSTVTAGDDSGSSKKNKGKGKVKTLETPTRPLRKRSLTVQGALSPRPSTADSLRDSPSAAAVAIPENAERPSKAAKLKLALPFAQVAASGSGSPSPTPRSLAPPPLSAASLSSFDSPQFAHPEDSD